MVSQLAEKPFRTVVVMTKTDVADSFGTTIDAKVLEKALGVRVLEVDPRHRSNLVAVGEAVTEEMRKEPKVVRPVTVPAGADPTVSEFDLADARFAWVEKLWRQQPPTMISAPLPGANVSIRLPFTQYSGP